MTSQGADFPGAGTCQELPSWPYIPAPDSQWAFKELGTPKLALIPQPWNLLRYSATGCSLAGHSPPDPYSPGACKLGSVSGLGGLEARDVCQEHSSFHTLHSPAALDWTQGCKEGLGFPTQMLTKICLDSEGALGI